MKYAIVFLITFVLSSAKSYSQPPSDYSYLISCFKNSTVDTFEIEIDGIGEVMSYNFSSDSVKVEASLTYYDIPANKRSKSTKKLAAFAANRQIDTWKNNSTLILYKEFKTASATIIDVRLHLRIEDIYMQVLVVLENNRVFEIEHFNDKNDSVSFDRLTEQVKTKICL